MVSPIPKRKRNPDGGAPLDPDNLELNTTNMEIDEANNMLTWVVVQLVESKLIARRVSPRRANHFLGRVCDSSSCQV
jgi:hypothetical protein